MDKILIVEDDSYNYLLIKEILSYYSVELVWAKNCKEFYEKIKRPARYNLILMDIMLPDGNGIDLTKFLINEKCKTPIIFISAYTDKCEEVYDMGIEFFISKPIMTELLLSIIAKFIVLEKL